MADKIVIELDLESGDVTGATKSLAKAGEKSGREAAKEFARNFNKNVGDNIGKLARSAAKATAVVAGLGSALATVIGVKAVAAAQIQEDAINALNSALSITKNAGLEASIGIQQYAAELQKTTRFGDEVIIQNAALIQSLGDLDEQGLKRATTAAADLASALRIDLTAAATLVGKAAAGEVGSFSRYGLAIKSGANNAETLSNALTAIEGKFGGAAARDVQTYSGAVDQLSNAYGDVFEEIGFIITRNPKFVNAIKAATDLMVEAGKRVSDFAANFDLFDFAANKLISFNQAIIENVIAPFELFTNVLQIVQGGLNQFVAESIASLGALGGGVATLLNKFGVDNPLTQGLKDFAETSNKVANENMVSLQNSIARVFDFPVSEKLATKNEELRTFFAEQNEIINENIANTNEKMANQTAKAAQTSMTLASTFSSTFNGLQSGIAGTFDTIDAIDARIKKFAAESGQALQKGFAGGAANAFAQFGAAIANGDNALQAFTNSLLKSIGEQAIALGTRFILEGTAYLFTPGFQGLGPPLIGAGAALAAFGGVIGASVGGASGGSSGGAGAVGSPEFEQRENLAEPEAVTRAEEQTALTINVEGSLVRESELGGFVSDLLEKTNSRGTSVIPSLRTA